MSKDVEEGDVFFFNERFSSKLYKIKIGTVSAQKEGEVEKQETRHKVCAFDWNLHNNTGISDVGWIVKEHCVVSTWLPVSFCASR